MAITGTGVAGAGPGVGAGVTGAGVRLAMGFESGIVEGWTLIAGSGAAGAGPVGIIGDTPPAGAPDAAVAVALWVMKYQAPKPATARIRRSSAFMLPSLREYSCVRGREIPTGQTET
jgi:hypothetical protein